MSTPILATKLYAPPPRPHLVSRPRLLEQLHQGLQLNHRLTLIAAPAGFGKTTLLGEWVAGCRRPVAWLSLEEEDSEPARFLTYLIAALQTVEPAVGQGVLAALQSPQLPPTPAFLTTLLNEIAAIPHSFALVLDDLHEIEAVEVENVLTFLLQHQPPNMHLVIATREDPQLPLARLRARGQLSELRARELRFTTSEAADFLNRTMALELSAEDIAALEARTEGWIAGLQLAAISMRGRQDTATFIDSFAGSHRFVLDYLVQEVLERQPESVQTFLLHTSILDRLCGPLCDAITPSTSGEQTLRYLEQANLFLIPLDDDRRWYRYHHLFAELLRQRLQQRAGKGDVNALHVRASIWHEEKGLELEAFRHAVAAEDIERAARLVAGDAMPLHYQGAVAPILNWLASLPPNELDARPSLWVTYASALTMVGRTVSAIEEKLQAAEASFQNHEPDDDLVGQIAAIRAMLAVPQNQVQTVIAQAQRALAYLDPHNLPARTSASWAPGHAYQLRGERAAAGQAFSQVLSMSQASGNLIFNIAALTGLGQLQEAQNQLHPAAENYRRVLQLAGAPPLAIASGAYLGLTRLLYEWNDLDAAEQHGQKALQLARLLENLDAPVDAWILLARLKIARGDASGAVALLARAEQFARHNKFEHRLPDIATAQTLALLDQGNLAAAIRSAEQYDLPISQARVRLAGGQPDVALALLEPLRRQAEAAGCVDEQLRVMAPEAVAHQVLGESDRAIEILRHALALAEPGSFVRLFVDEGPPMMALLSEVAKHDLYPTYVRQIQEAFEHRPAHTAVTQALPEPLTERERQVLKLLATDLNGPAIARELMVSLNTMRTHTKNIYGKLAVNSRRAAIRRARKLNLL